MNTAMNTGQSSGYSGGYSRGQGNVHTGGYYQAQSRGAICSDSASRTFLAVAGGAAVGALVMYLLDPEQGSNRRRYTGHLAGAALSNTASALGSAWESTKDITSKVGTATTAGASAFRGALSDSAEYVGNTRIGRGASRFGGEASDRFGYLMHGRRSSSFIDSGVGQALAGIGFLALGVTTMYYFDPRQGTGRRSVCRDQFLSGFNRMARSLDRLGRHLFNRATGMAHEARSSMTREQADDRVIVDRVRAGIGHCISNTGAVQVHSRNGRVTLTGHVLASEADALLKCAWAVRGVKEIINQLQIRSHEGPEHTQSQAGSTTASTRPATGISASSASVCPPGSAI